MATKLHLEISTPEKPILKESVDEVVIPALRGELGVLPGHTTLLTTLGEGVLMLTSEGIARSMEISGGIAEICNDQVTILADHVREKSS